MVIIVALHLFAVGAAMMAILVCPWLEWRATRRRDLVAARLGQSLAWQSLVLLLAGMALGALVLVALGDYAERYFNAARQIPQRRLWFGLVELLFSVLCIAAYCYGWQRWSRWRLVHRTLAVVASTNLMYHFPPLFVVIGFLSTRPEMWGGGRRFVTLMLERECAARIVHHWLAAAALAGGLVIAQAARWSRWGASDAEAARVAAWGARIAAVAVALQFPAGMAVFLNASHVARHALLGGDWLATALFAASVLTTIWLLQQLVAMALGDATSAMRRRSLLLLAVVMCLMVGTRHRTRSRLIDSLAAHSLPNAAARETSESLVAPHSANSISTR